MNAIPGGFWWLVVGFVIGWLCGWLSPRRRRTNPATPPRTEPAPPAEEPVATLERSDSEAAPPSRIIDVGAARAAGFNLKHGDDLTIIEGIGPRIDDLLHANGVTSFAQLAQLGVPEMLDILERGGPHFQLANPGAWARQATLASENRWGELKRLQEELISGESMRG